MRSFSPEAVAVEVGAYETSYKVVTTGQYTH